MVHSAAKESQGLGISHLLPNPYAFSTVCLACFSIVKEIKDFRKSLSFLQVKFPDYCLGKKSQKVPTFEIQNAPLF